MFCLLFLITLSSGCLSTPRDRTWGNADPSFGYAEGPQQPSPEARGTLKAFVDAAQLRDLDYPNFQNYRTEVEEFYEAFSDTLPWIQGRRSSPQAQALVNLFKQADEEGLNPVDYDGPRWDGRLRTIDSGRSSESELVRFDLAVTISTMCYISDLHRGRVNPHEFHFDLDIENKKIDLSEFLRQKLAKA